MRFYTPDKLIQYSRFSLIPKQRNVSTDKLRKIHVRDSLGVRPLCCLPWQGPDLRTILLSRRPLVPKQLSGTSCRRPQARTWWPCAVNNNAAKTAFITWGQNRSGLALRAVVCWACRGYRSCVTDSLRSVWWAAWQGTNLESLGVEHDFSNVTRVRNDHRNGAEEGLEIVRKLSTTWCIRTDGTSSEVTLPAYPGFMVMKIPQVGLSGMSDPSNTKWLTCRLIASRREEICRCQPE